MGLEWVKVGLLEGLLEELGWGWWRDKSGIRLGYWRS